MLRATGLLLALLLLLTACGDDPAPAVMGPAWAKVAPEQIAEAEKRGVSVAFENDLGMRFVLIPAGSFEMRFDLSPAGPARDGQRAAKVDRPYFAQVREVTNVQFRHFRPAHESGAWKGHDLNADAQPVTSVSWSDAREFASRVTATRGGRTCRLPSEVEWEYAFRAGGATEYVWGEDPRDGRLYANGVDQASARLPAWRICQLRMMTSIPQLRLWVCSFPTGGGCMTCWETRLSGVGTRRSSCSRGS